jgi:FtsH-binding integral membrane protein
MASEIGPERRIVALLIGLEIVLTLAVAYIVTAYQVNVSSPVFVALVAAASVALVAAVVWFSVRLFRMSVDRGGRIVASVSIIAALALVGLLGSYLIFYYNIHQLGVR